MSCSPAPPLAAHPSRPSGGYPAEILLDQSCRIGYLENSTSARAENSEGLCVEASFEIRAPPAVSLCFARWYDLTGRQRAPGPGEPTVLAVAGGFALLAIPFSEDDGDVKDRWRYMEYFVYRAGPGAPSLDALPGPYPPICSMKAAVLPVCDDGEHYAVVFPAVHFVVLESRHYYTLHVYRSDSRAWSARAAQIADDDAETLSAAVKVALHCPTSVVHAGSGLIGWVDLWWGVLLCNVLDEEPTIRFVALPVPEPSAMLTEFLVEFQNQNPRPYRQMTVYEGVIKLVELNFHRDDQGWMATTWTRPISSDVWHEGRAFDTSDISVADSSFLHLLPGILDEEKKLTWKNVMSGAPTLSLHDDDIVYIMARVGLCDPTPFVLTVSTRNLMLESCAQCADEKMPGLEPTYVPSVLSGFWDVLGMQYSGYDSLENLK